jgi:protein tyrosine/serine phosphatase
MLLAAWAGHALYKHWRWKRFAVVEPGGLYRSGQLTVVQLDSAIRRLQLRAVISFNSESAAEEQELCASRGVAFVCLPMPADGIGEPRQFFRFLELAQDPAYRPMLVHCSAGVARTGAAIALYRMTLQGWPFDAAVAELRSFERRGRVEDALKEHIERIHEQWQSKSSAKSSSVPERIRQTSKQRSLATKVPTAEG